MPESQTQSTGRAAGDLVKAAMPYIISAAIGAGSSFFAAFRTFEIKLFAQQTAIEAIGERVNGLDKWKEFRAQELSDLRLEITKLTSELKSLQRDFDRYPNPGR